MVHYAGYRRDSTPPTSRPRVGTAWAPTGRSPTATSRHYERVERELPVAGQNWPWGDPHSYPFSPHPVSGAALRLWRCASARHRDAGRPVGIVNGTFGNRPHCIYRGYCLQGCKVNAKASPYVTHLPDALAHGVEVRADSMAVRIALAARRAATASATCDEGSVE